MKLESAYICLDCDEVFEDGDGVGCPSCSNRYVVALSKWIRPLKDEQLGNGDERD